MALRLGRLPQRVVRLSARRRAVLKVATVERTLPNSHLIGAPRAAERATVRYPPLAVGAIARGIGTARASTDEFLRSPARCAHSRWLMRFGHEMDLRHRRDGSCEMQLEPPSAVLILLRQRRSFGPLGCAGLAHRLTNPNNATQTRLNSFLSWSARALPSTRGLPFAVSSRITRSLGSAPPPPCTTARCPREESSHEDYDYSHTNSKE
jgi:hypothetical protein